MTDRRRQFLSSCREAGYHTRPEAGGAWLIIKRGNAGKPLRGMRIHANGTGTDIMVDLAVAKGMRSYKQWRRHLGIDARA